MHWVAFYGEKDYLTYACTELFVVTSYHAQDCLNTYTRIKFFELNMAKQFTPLVSGVETFLI